MDLWLKHFAMKAGEIIREAREKRGWSQKYLGELVGVSQPAIKKIESGETIKSKHLPKIAQLLNIDLSLLDPAMSPDSNSPVRKIASPNQPLRVSRLEQDQILGKYDLPVFSLAPGGQGALVLSNQPFRAIARPQNLLGIEGAFGIQIVGDSMAREYREGDIAYVDPHAPPRVGEACLFQSEEHGTIKVIIRYLEKSPHHSAEFWFVSQSNPEKKFQLKKSEWQTCYVLVGKQSGR